MKSHRIMSVLMVFALASATAHAAAPNASSSRNSDVSISNWDAPPTWTPSAQSRDPRAAEQDAAAAASEGAVRQPLIAVTPTPLEFVPVAPCRVIDTRTGSGFSGAYGPPPMFGLGAQRTFTITGLCGIPAGAQAVSFNFAVWAPTTRGDLKAFPGPSTPNASTMNWEAGILALANAAVVPLSSAGAITVQIDGPANVDIFVDVNGYYGPTGSLPHGVNASGGYVNSGGFYFYPVTVTLPTGGACLVTSQAQLELGASPTSFPYFRIAVKHGAAADTTDGFYGHYFGTLSGSYSTDQSRTSLITVNPNEATQFGCFIGNASAGDISGNLLYLTCQTSYLCF